jgi:hypothetical protein
MAAADLIAFSTPPVYVILNCLKDSRHLPDVFSCYGNFSTISFCVSTGVTYTRLSMYPQRKKSNGVKSMGRKGQFIGHPRPILPLPKGSFKYSRTTLVQCARAP